MNKIFAKIQRYSKQKLSCSLQPILAVKRNTEHTLAWY